MPSKPPPEHWPVDAPDRYPGYLLWRTALLWQRRLNAALRPLKLTHMQFMVLAAAVWMERLGQPATQVRIAHVAGADAMSVSQVTRALEDRGLLQRKPHPEDTRAVLVLPTPGGRKLSLEALAVVTATEQAFFGVLPPQGQEQLLESLRGLLVQDDRPAGS